MLFVAYFVMFSGSSFPKPMLVSNSRVSLLSSLSLSLSLPLTHHNKHLFELQLENREEANECERERELSESILTTNTTTI